MINRCEGKTPNEDTGLRGRRTSYEKVIKAHFYRRLPPMFWPTKDLFLFRAVRLEFMLSSMMQLTCTMHGMVASGCRWKRDDVCY